MAMTSAERSRKWRLTNPLKKKLGDIAWRKLNPKREKFVADRWRAKNKDKLNAQQRARRALKRTLDETP
jgi:hypothetical protein